MGNTHRRYRRRTLLAGQRAMGISLDTFSNDRVTDVSANRQAREYSETIYSHYHQRIKRFTGTRNQ